MFGRKLARALRRRRLLALGGVGAAMATTALVGSPPTAHAAQIIGSNNFSGTLDTNADGVQGFASGANNAGTFGRNNDTNGIGASGTAPSGTGVYGESNTGFGVGGRSTSQYGVFGVSTNSFGVTGVSSQNYGVYGVGSAATTGSGVCGTSPYIAVLGSTTTGIGILGYASDPNGWGGQFVGRVYVNGSFTVVNGAKSAAVPHPDGTLRRVYCQESPEPYFEDFGQATLSNGRATVALEATFAALIQADSYLVFLTEVDGHNALFVTARTPTGFEVRSATSPSASGAFAYRIVAKRKDIVAPRLDRVTLPVKASDLPAVPSILDTVGPPDRTPTGTPTAPSTPLPTVSPSTTSAPSGASAN